MNENRSNTKWFIIATIGVIVLVALWAINFAVATKSELVRKETYLTEIYTNNQTELNELITGATELIGVANAGSTAISNVIGGALEGRYGEDGADLEGALVVVISEAYPEAGPAEVAQMYRDVSAYIADHRAEFTGYQEVMAGGITNYDTWRREDPVRSMFIDLVGGAPSESLRVTIARQSYYGQAAYDMMISPITSETTQDAFETGTYNGIAIPTPGS